MWITAITGAVKGVTSIIGNAQKQKALQEQRAAELQQAILASKKKAKQNNTPLFVILGVVVALSLVGAYLLIKKK